MVQVFDETNFEGTTVSFNESVKGWTSVKSFVPENGLSLTKKYFTVKNGSLYNQYVTQVRTCHCGTKGHNNN